MFEIKPRRIKLSEKAQSGRGSVVVRPTEPLPLLWVIKEFSVALVLVAYSRNNSEYMMAAPKMAISKCTPALEKCASSRIAGMSDEPAM